MIEVADFLVMPLYIRQSPNVAPQSQINQALFAIGITVIAVVPAIALPVGKRSVAGDA
jgi:hypothetical protein